MASAFDLGSMTDAVQAFLMDVSATTFGDDAVEESIRLALGEYSNAIPQLMMGTVTPAANREADLSDIDNLLAVMEVHFPYDADNPAYPPNQCLYRTYIVHTDGETPTDKLTLYVDCDEAPSGSDLARILYTMPHTLTDLDDATATTFPIPDEGLLIQGAAGHALMARAIDVAETDSLSAVSTPNYAALASRYLKQFRTQLSKRSRI